MLISDFIKELEEFKNEVGDVQILMLNEYGDVDDFDCFISKPFDDCDENAVLLEM